MKSQQSTAVAHVCFQSDALFVLDNIFASKVFMQPIGKRAPGISRHASLPTRQTAVEIEICDWPCAVTKMDEVVGQKGER